MIGKDVEFQYPVTKFIRYRGFMIHPLFQVILVKSVKNILIFFMERVDCVVLNSYITIMSATVELNTCL